MVVAYGLVLATVLLGNTPKLGLDLQGGVSVNLQPVKDGEVDDSVKPEQLDQAIEIIRRRVDASGVAEPEVSRQGNTILIQIPGAKDQQEVLTQVGRTAELRFRPVLSQTGGALTGDDKKKAEAEAAELRTALNIPEGVTASQVATDEQAKQPTTTTTPPPAAETPPTTAAPATTTTALPATTIDPTAGNGGGRSFQARGQDGTTTTTTVPPTPLNQYGVNVYDEKFGELYNLETQLTSTTTSPDDDKADQEVSLPGLDGSVYKLGPTLLTGRTVEDAQAGLQNGNWTVNPVFRGGEDGIDQFNAAAAKCNAGDPTCPGSSGQPGRLAIVLDSEVLSAPTINQANFSRDQIEISGSFTEDEAKALAVSLRFGSLPLELKAQQAETVSATLGEGALQAGIIAGVIGLFLVCLYLLFYYRLLGLATIGSLTISASLLWVFMANIGATVTLAGVVGIVVSIGISLDSSVVFFESIKEDVRNGAALRSSVDKSFNTAYSTIVKADMSSLIGALVLYWLSVGPVRGFALYLGIATILDLVSAYFYLRPAVVLMARSKQGEHPNRLGIPVDDLPDPGSATRGRKSRTQPADADAGMAATSTDGDGVDTELVGPSGASNRTASSADRASGEDA